MCPQPPPDMDLDSDSDSDLDDPIVREMMANLAGRLNDPLPVKKWLYQLIVFLVGILVNVVPISFPALIAVAIMLIALEMYVKMRL